MSNDPRCALEQLVANMRLQDGIALSTDTTGHEHDEGGKFTHHASAAADSSKKTETKGLKQGEHHVATGLALKLSRKAARSGNSEDHKSAVEAHKNAMGMHRSESERWRASTAESAGKLGATHFAAAHHHEQAMNAHHNEAADIEDSDDLKGVADRYGQATKHPGY